MKTLFVALMIVAQFTCNAFAQKTDVVISKATYEFIHIRDTANRDKPYRETMVLLIGNNATVYRSLSKQQQDEKLANQIADQVKHASDPNHLNLTITGSGVTTSDEYYQYVNDKKLFTEEKIINYYLIEEPLPNITWKIMADTATINTLHCQKATCYFKGRNYSAWFCADLPFRNGPWKLSGLPGLIVEASDNKREVIFKFMGFENVSKSDQQIAPPADDIKTTPKALARLKEARDQDPQGFRKGSMGGNSSSRDRGLPMANVAPSRISSINVVKAPDGNTNIINNPIELPEKK